MHRAFLQRYTHIFLLGCPQPQRGSHRSHLQLTVNCEDKFRQNPDRTLRSVNCKRPSILKTITHTVGTSNLRSLLVWLLQWSSAPSRGCGVLNVLRSKAMIDCAVCCYHGLEREGMSSERGWRSRASLYLGIRDGAE